MPYDDAGNFYYPLPGRKSKPRVAKPSPTPADNSVSVASPVVEKSALRHTVETNSPTAAIDKSASELAIEAAPPGDWHLQPPENRLLTIHEGNNRWQISELDLALIWNAQPWQSGFTLATSDGAAVEVVYRGRWSGGFGPDFKGAIVRVGNRLLRGDVELHLRSGDWRLHGHHQDPRYNNVVLQFALEDNSFPPEQTHAGAELPVIALLPLFKLANISLQAALVEVKANGTRLGSISESSEPCCNRIAERHPNLPELLRRLDKLGEQRFEERAGRYEAAATLDADGDDQAATESLWSGLLEALGYSQNKTPFKKLAEALPFATIVNFDREARLRREKPEERLLTIEALLLGAAGLLPSQRNLRPVKKAHTHVHDAKTDYSAPDDDSKFDFIAATYTDELERRWDLLRRGLDSSGAFLREKDWVFARLRPPNHPARRIAGLARLVVRLNLDEPADFLEELAEIMELEPGDACKAFGEFCRVGLAATDSDSGLFWARRYDFADRALLADMRAKGATADLIGADRAADITVNVFLPFCAAYGRDRYRASLAKAALAAYHAHPRLSSNELVDNMAKQVLQKWLGQPAPEDGKPYTVNRLITGACRQQGLIYLQRTFCAEQNFAACPLS